MKIKTLTTKMPFPGLWLIPVLVSLVINYNVLQNGHGWDDEDIIPQIQVQRTWWSIFFPNNVDADILNEYPPYYRPMVTLSYQLDHILWDKQVFGYHLSVLLGHILNTGLIFFLTQRLVLLSPSFRKGFPSDHQIGGYSPSEYLPLMVATLFGVHPIHSEAIAWIPGRSDVFYTMFALVALSLYTLSSSTTERQTKGRSRKTLWSYALSMFFLLLGMLTKEAALGLIFLFPLYDYLVDQSEAFSKKKMSRVFFRFLGPSLVVAIYLGLRSNYLESHAGKEILGSIASSTSPLLSVISVTGLYIKLLLIPFPHLPFITDLEASTGTIILSTLSILTILSLFLYGMYHRHVLISIGIGWMLLSLIPSLLISIRPIATTVAAERYLYGPSLGFLMVLCFLIQSSTSKSFIALKIPSNKIAVWGTLFFLMWIAAFGWESRFRNTVWRNTLTFWEAAVKVSPHSGDVQRALGMSYAKLGNNHQAEAFFLSSISIYRQSNKPRLLADSLNDLAGLYYHQHRYDSAEALYHQALAIREGTRTSHHEEVANTYNNLGLVYAAQGRDALAEEFYEKSLRLLERSSRRNLEKISEVLNNRAISNYSQGHFDVAASQLDRVLAIRTGTLGENHPLTAQALNNLAVAYDALNRREEALSLYERSLRIRERTLGAHHPDTAQTLNNLGSLYYSLGNHDQAESYYRRSIDAYGRNEKHPLAMADALNNLASLYVDQGKPQEAKTLFERAMANLKLVSEESPRQAKIRQNYESLLKRLDVSQHLGSQEKKMDDD